MRAYLEWEATIKPLFNPGCPTSWARHEIIRHAYSNGDTLRPFSKKNEAELVTSIACVELWYGFYI
jgi:hypothetical protein